MINVGLQVDDGFARLYNSIPRELRQMDGVDKLDSFALAEDYLEARSVADISVDPNANINGKSPPNFESEIHKPLRKLWGLYLFWKGAAERWGEKRANMLLRMVADGHIYIHDLTKTAMPYCFVPDSSFLLNEGRPYGYLPSVPPKKARSFVGQTIEVTMELSQQYAGAEIIG